MSNQQAVIVQHAYKNYGSRRKPIQVFIDLNMTVQQGTIYGLLGASGCGKTTLLSCIVGIRKLDKGEVWALGGKPGKKGSGIPGRRVGYMPQETALYGEFSIKETMVFFGWIFGMETPDIKKKLEFLLKLLELPTDNRLVKNLSGGQKRRVSFAVAIMHDPELIILDEPTVGVDPLLRQNIWSHLVQLSTDEKRTVIITTHYIEEARQAHTIGLMRNGVLLAEASPKSLLSSYNKSNLEEVFLLLSRQQIDTKPEVREAPDIKIDFKYEASTGHKKTRSPTFGKLKALLKKNIYKMWRNVGILLFIFILPILQISLFCLAVGQDPKDLKIAVVTDEINYTSPGQKCPYEPGCNLSKLSCRFLDLLNKNTTRIFFYPDESKAVNAVKRGEAWCALHFRKEFSEASISRMTLGAATDNTTLANSQIHTWLDMSNNQIALIIQRDLRDAFEALADSLVESCRTTIGAALAAPHIYYNKPVYGDNNPSFLNFVAPGVILTIIFFLAVAITSSTIIVERTEGMLDRCLVAGVTPVEILFSHVATQFFVMCGQTALVLIFMSLVFDVEIKGNIGWVIALTVLQGFCGMSYGFVISAVCDLERDAIQLALGSFYPVLLMSGVIWPVEGMPHILKHIAMVLPLTMATQALRAILSRGWDISEPEVYLGFISTIVWIVLYLAICLLILRIKHN